MKFESGKISTIKSAKVLICVAKQKNIKHNNGYNIPETKA